MYFSLVDRVLEVSSDAAATLKVVSMAEEYLQDHFPSFPVLPGVLMLEAMVQTCREVARARGIEEPLVLGQVRALKYNRFVQPGYSIRTCVKLTKADDQIGELVFKCTVELVDPVAVSCDATSSQAGQPVVAASGRITLRPVKIAMPL